MFMAGTLEANEKQQYDPFLANLLEYYYNHKKLNFLAPIVFILIGGDLFVVTFHGYIKFALRFFSLPFQPFMLKESFLTSFLCAAYFVLVYMHALTYMIVDLFRPYMRGTQAAIFF